jgi:hypothetical protein
MQVVGLLAPLPCMAQHSIYTAHTISMVHTAQADHTPLLHLQDNTPLWRRMLRRKLQHHSNKPLWISEFGTGRGPLSLAKQIVKDLSTLKPTAWVYW